MKTLNHQRATTARKTNAILIEPRFGYSKDGATTYKPAATEVLHELSDAVNFFADRRRFPIALNFWFHLATCSIFAVFIIYFLSPDTLGFLLLSLIIIGTVYNTIWYHRYCSHASFTFSRSCYRWIFLWTTPLLFRESTYAIPHRVHHQLAERPGDPYGPHFGWLGNYLAVDSSMKLNTEITRAEYEALVQSISHIGFKTNDFDSFKKTGSIENLTYYISKSIFAHLFWLSTFFFAGGAGFVAAWYSAVFLVAALIRDFNWRGHGGDFRKTKKLGWEFDTKSNALNQRFYGLIASEWHDNHHKYPFSANNGFLPGQIDVAFQIIKLLHRLGIVDSYIDAKPLFQKECLELSATKL
jgi:stearoyl-CoA desaturase (delta-9 desaturase)